MSNDKEQIEQTVQVYFDSMYESDSEKVDKAFHPSAMISGNFGGSFSEMTREAFGKFVASQQPRQKKKENPPSRNSKHRNRWRNCCRSSSRRLFRTNVLRHSIYGEAGR